MNLDVGDARSSHTQNLVEQIRADKIFDTFFPPPPSEALARGTRRVRPVAGVWPALHAVARSSTAAGTLWQAEHGQRGAHVHLPQATPWFREGQPAMRRVPAAMLRDC